MNEFSHIKEEVKQHYSARASLAILGLKTRQMKLFKPIEQQVKIEQKRVKYSPTDKLMDGYIAILAGAHGMIEINKRVRPDRGLQIAFGRDGCAEQSVVQDTLDACSPLNVEQMEEAMRLIYRQHSQGYHHRYDQQLQLIDIDMTGRPCGKKATFASRGYFAKQRNRRGRQVGYVVATHYEEIVVEHLFDGKSQLPTALRPLVKAAAKTLALDKAKRERTILRIDSGGGSVDDINWLLAQDYHLHGKDYSGTRAKKLADSVTEWLTDPANPDRQFGWVTNEPDIYCRPVYRIAVRCRKNNGQWGIGVILSSLSAQQVLDLTDQPQDHLLDPATILLAYVHFYDQRGGGVEIEIKEDKQGLGTTKRNKKRFAAQQMVILLEALAHNTLVWIRHRLRPLCPAIANFGMLRLVRDVFHMDGLLRLDHQAHIFHIILNQADPFARKLSSAFAALLAQHQLALSLGET